MNDQDRPFKLYLFAASTFPALPPVLVKLSSFQNYNESVPAPLRSSHLSLAAVLALGSAPLFLCRLLSLLFGWLVAVIVIIVVFK